MLRTESEHDCYGAGHAGTALSAALGMAVARDLAGGKEHVVALCRRRGLHLRHHLRGAQQHRATQTKRLIVVLNDNEWSIDKNVGAIAEYFNKIVTNAHVRSICTSVAASSIAEDWAAKPRRSRAQGGGSRQENAVAPACIFEELGLSYYGPIDGHDIATADRDIRIPQDPEPPGVAARPHAERPGLRAGAREQKKFHGLGPYDPETGETKPAGQQTYSEVFAETLVKLANMNDEGRGDHRGHAQRHGAGSLPAPPSRHDISTSASPRNTPCSSPPGWRPRVTSRSARSIPLSCSALRPDRA